jgi:hypothetical protein
MFYSKRGENETAPLRLKERRFGCGRVAGAKIRSRAARAVTKVKEAAPEVSRPSERRTRRGLSISLDRSTPGQEIDHEDDERHDEQKVNQPTADVRDQSEKPEHEKNNQNRPKHRSTLPEV